MVIEARKLSVKVILVNKMGGNATIMAAGGFAGNFNSNNEGIYNRKESIHQLTI